MHVRDIYEFLDPEKAKELSAVHGATVSSWKDVASWDDVVPNFQKSIVSHLEEEKKGCKHCPFLDKKDNYFYFCKARMPQLLKVYSPSERPTPASAEYHAHLDHIALQLWCMQSEDYQKCLFFSKSERESHQLPEM